MEVPTLIGHRMKGMSIYPDEGLHPTMDVAFNNDHARLIGDLGDRKALGQCNIYLKGTVEVYGVEQGITVCCHDQVAHCQNADMRDEPAFTVVQDKPAGREWRYFRHRHIR